MPYDPILIEHAIDMTSGMLVRTSGLERVYPLAEWIKDQQHHGGRVWRRRIVIVEEWVEVPRA